MGVNMHSAQHTPRNRVERNTKGWRPRGTVKNEECSESFPRVDMKTNHGAPALPVLCLASPPTPHYPRPLLLLLSPLLHGLDDLSLEFMWGCRRRVVFLRSVLQFLASPDLLLDARLPTR